jgi:outer membrane protein OmpA-like peptidoglycan-associated protein
MERRRLLALAVSLSLAACTRSPAAPDVVSQPPPSLASGVVDPVTIPRGPSRAPDDAGVSPLEALAAEAGPHGRGEADAATDGGVTFSERAAVEALDRIAAVFTIQHEPGRKRIVLRSDDLFEPGRDTLTGASSLRLGDLATALRAQGPHTVRVVAYTDALGDPRENVVVSRRRADVIRSYFVAQGVSPDRIVAEGRGATHSIASNATADGRAENRRVEVLIE